jgi:hypothetical protein
MEEDIFISRSDAVTVRMPSLMFIMKFSRAAKGDFDGITGKTIESSFSSNLLLALKLIFFSELNR